LASRHLVGMVSHSLPDLPHLYLEGVRLFNQGAFWHAHEQWEQCWLAVQEPDTTFYQGLIQAAAALVHWQRGNLRGLQRNWAKARPKLVALPSPMHQLDLHALISAMDHFVIARGASERVPMLTFIPNAVTVAEK
jgi:predicted metal-dependent hydrolase